MSLSRWGIRMFEEIRKLIRRDEHYLKILLDLNRLLVKAGLVRGSSFIFFRNGKEYVVSEFGEMDLPHTHRVEMLKERNGEPLGYWTVARDVAFDEKEHGLLHIVADLLAEAVFFDEWEYDYSFTQNRGCRFFPCHEVPDIREFNCLFCYCPLYSMPDCGGDFTILEQNGLKDCSDCMVPHDRENYGFINDKLRP